MIRTHQSRNRPKCAYMRIICGCIPHTIHFLRFLIFVKTLISNLDTEKKGCSEAAVFVLYVYFETPSYTECSEIFAPQTTKYLKKRFMGHFAHQAFLKGQNWLGWLQKHNLSINMSFDWKIISVAARIYLVWHM